MEALFLEHEGYFGSLGAFLLEQEDTCRDESIGGRLGNFTKFLKSTFQDKPKAIRKYRSIKT